MGRPIIEDDTQLIKNGPFYNANYWAPVPPWTIAGGKAIWSAFNSTLGNDLTQQIYAGANETYLCHFRAIVTAPGRGFSFDIADQRQIFNLGTGVYDETFELTPTVPGNFVCQVGQAFGIGSVFSIWNISVIGTPVGDPTYDLIFSDGFTTVPKTLTEFDDLGGGEKMHRIASRGDSSNCLVKIE